LAFAEALVAAGHVVITGGVVSVKVTVAVQLGQLLAPGSQAEFSAVKVTV
jgi:hypothetical protein